eukprot:2526154-Rhodomonas_salina.3
MCDTEVGYAGTGNRDTLLRRRLESREQAQERGLLRSQIPTGKTISLPERRTEDQALKEFEAEMLVSRIPSTASRLPSSLSVASLHRPSTVGSAKDEMQEGTGT